MVNGNWWVRHLVLPLIMPFLFFANALAPVYVLGCRTRGLVALVITLISIVWAVAATVIAVKKRLQGEADSVHWVLTALITLIPVAGMLVLA